MTTMNPDCPDSYPPDLLPPHVRIRHEPDEEEDEEDNENDDKQDDDDDEGDNGYSE